MGKATVLGDGSDSTDAVQWLLSSDEPAVRVLARRDLLGEENGPDQSAITGGRLVGALLAGQRADGGFGSHPYAKWTGAHWRLVSLVELALPPGEPRAVAAARTVLDWLCAPARLAAVKVIQGLPRRCASQEGNALAVCCRLGLADERVDQLSQLLLTWQWPDGGWNCDLGASGRRSSFHETLPAMWGLWEHHRRTGHAASAEAAKAAAELLLQHGLFRSLSTGEVIERRWLVPRYPPYWHYDILQALLILRRMGLADDPRAAEASDLLRARRLPAGRWDPGSGWWKPPGSSRGPVEAVDWGRGASEMTTLNALRVLEPAHATALDM